MKLLMYGISTDTTSHNDINRYQLNKNSKIKHLNDIKEFTGVEELVILTSFYRTEYYLHVDEKTFKHGDLLRYLSDFTEKALNEIILETYSMFNEDVINHLYTLTSGMHLDDQNIPEALKNTEDAISLAVDKNTVEDALLKLFNNAVEYVLTIQSNATVAPIRKGEVSKFLNAMDSNLPDVKGKNVVFVGENDQVVFLSKQLLFKGAQSVTICTENNNYKTKILNNLHYWRTIPTINKLLKNLHVINVEACSYRVSSSDVVVLLTSAHNTVSSLEEIDNSRLTKKRQILLDLSDVKNEKIDLNHSIIDYLDGLKNFQRNFTNNEIEKASGFFEESLEIASKKFMETYSYLHQQV